MTASEKEVKPCIDLAKKRIALNEGVRIAKLNYDYVDIYIKIQRTLIQFSR